ncbi:MAG: alpha/beta hydrolase [Proteobacteria bacterium]|nr:alpha/beta hydrolase [Pseudomonadota bacterium]
MKRIVLSVLVISFMLTTACWASSGTYDYPMNNGLAATILGTPKEYKAPVPKEIKMEQKMLTVFHDRVPPEVYWYQKGLQYFIVKQKGPAPLIFMIAGTGASHNSAKNRAMARAFYQAGFHVVSIPSPTHPNFIVTASSTMVPGKLEDDSRDIYRVMQMIMQEGGKNLQVTDYYLTGYSLGATQSAYVSKLDEEMQAFNFKKVLMINPSVSLFNSVEIIDDMLVDNIPGGIENFPAFWDDMFKTFSDAFAASDAVVFGPEFLYKAYKKKRVEGAPPNNERMSAMIGFAFRISSASMLFTSDVMSNSGVIKPKNLELSRNESLSDYAKVTVGMRFIDYFDEILYPYYKAKQPDLSRQEMLDALGLKNIDSYLRNATKISMVTNNDDFILASGEIDYLRQVFQDRGKFYPKGGHCGNMDYKDNVAYMIDYFTN